MNCPMLNVFWGSDGTGIHLGLKNQGSNEIEGSNPFFPILKFWADKIKMSANKMKYNIR